jgi:hypothetical protein
MRLDIFLRFLSACVSTLACVTAQAQDVTTAVAGFRLYKLAGLYEYSRDGVPLLGFVTQKMNNGKKMDNGMVNFTTCGNKTMELDFKELKATPAACPPPKKDPGPWTARSNDIVPVLKAEAGAKGASEFQVVFARERLNLLELPPDFKGYLMKAKVGDQVGFAFTDVDGKKSIAMVVKD